MRLKYATLTHFRGCRVTTVIPIGEVMTCILGSNNYGKSTILKILAIFLETEGATADKCDTD